MPLLAMKTNIAIDDKPALAQSLSSKVAELLHKPERYVMVNLQDQQALMFGGSDDAAIYLELKSINLPESETAQISSALCDFISQQLAVKQNRIYIEFSNAERHMWGWNGATF
ncbi:MAG: phenylpyruvate tautomerase MIF-related protein [Gammaproteobacteria bacterium]|nr:phenylpyruvate tautomerase MIF-related protein [Gammaproteobacteria bacterium]